MPSYLDDPYRFADAPRWARHYYANALRAGGCARRVGQTTITEFAVWPIERAEFPELVGVTRITLYDDGLHVRADVTQRSIAVFEMHDDVPQPVFVGFHNVADAFRTIDNFLREAPGYFHGIPFVATETDPAHPIPRPPEEIP